MSRSRSLFAVIALTAVAAAPAVVAPTPQGDAPAVATLAAPTLDVLGDLCVPALDDAAGLVTAQATGAPARDLVDGVGIAIVIDPMIAPGIPTPVLATGDGACDLTTFNHVVAPLRDGAAAVASAFARIAAMPWLGQDLAVEDLAVDGDTVALTTVGGRHGVSSDWTITVDARGIRTATFETTDFGLDVEHQDIHDLEGVTSLPGHSRTWNRDAAGLLQLEQSIGDDIIASMRERDAAAARAADIAGLAPGDLLEQTFDDGLTLTLTYGVAATGVETPRTSVDQADRLVNLHEGMGELYRDMQGWGVVEPFDNTTRTYFGFGTVVPDERGYINIDSGLSAYCLACAFLTDGVEIHMAFIFPDVAPEVVGASYPDREAFFVDVLGHEFVHSLQGGYSDGAGGALTNSFIEGTARASEALFAGSANTFQDGSIAYLDNGNGCEGFDNGRGGWITAQSTGPFLQGHTYDSCYFWWTYYAEHGPEGLVRLLEQLAPTLAERDGQNAASLNLELLDLASPIGDGTVDLAHWAAAYTAGSEADGFTITAANETPQDWFSLLSLAHRSSALRTTPQVADVSNGGTRGFEVERTGTLSALPTGAEAFLWSNDDGALRLLGSVVVGDAVEAGQLLTVVAPTTGPFTGSVDID